ncbi:MAG: hypothetical protein M0C28_24535 [Candidatus Moduliflexus flocculans]|nr:hypothetical protein [Candidatus Moduliflexus flocculans]
MADVALDPAPDLAEAVAALWATDAQTSAFRERVLPRETVELMINFGARQTIHQIDRPLEPLLFRPFVGLRAADGVSGD